MPFACSDTVGRQVFDFAPLLGDHFNQSFIFQTELRTYFPPRHMKGVRKVKNMGCELALLCGGE